MRHRRRLQCTALCLLSIGLTCLAAIASDRVTGKTFEISGGQFRLDGKPLQIISGEIHYPRIPHQYWRHRLRMAKACGLNAITTYVFWNVHEPEKGKFDFKGDADIARFIRIAQEEGLWVIVRPGPYVCAEWDFGGFPYWLLTEKGLGIRTRDPVFIAYVQRYYDQLAKQLRPLQIHRGGPIVMVQVENEYGSYGSDKVYMTAIRDATLKAGFEVPLFTCDGGSQTPNGYLSGLLPGVNGGSGPEIRAVVDEHFPGGPYFVPEHYPGWLDHWGEPKQQVSTERVVAATERMLSNGISFNYYMFHGGTNFGFTSGANYGSNFQPDLTSYDYDAPLDEAGRATPKYLAIRDAIRRYLGGGGSVLPDVPAANPVVRVPRFYPTESGSLLGSLPKPRVSERPLPMEALGQDYGYALYRTTVQGPFAGKLTVNEVRDFAVVMVNGERAGVLDRRRKGKSIPLTLPAGKVTLDLLVENGGRINFGEQLTDNLKGITHSAHLQAAGKADRELTGWQIYSLPFKKTGGLALDGKESSGPTLRRGHFSLDTIGDAFLDMRAYTKGVVWINGHNLGRYWKIGPQQTLYVPGPWLKRGANEIVILDLLPTGQTYVEGLPQPVLTELNVDPLHPPRPKLSSPPAPDPEALITSGEFNAGEAAQDLRFKPWSARYILFRALDSHDGDYASGAEFYLLDRAGVPLPRDKWKILYASSEESIQEDGSADNLIDDDLATIWHTIWSVPHPPLPQYVVIDLGEAQEFSGVRYLARRGEKPAKTKRFELYSADPPL